MLCPQIADPAKLDAIFVPIGGGGLIAGIAAYVKVLHPHIKVRLIILNRKTAAMALNLLPLSQ